MDSQRLMHATRPRRQAGFTLMEGVVSMAISLVTTAAMVALMSNSLGTTSRIVNMTKLSDDLRNTMQLMSRDLRRASYNANAILCYGNQDCASDGSVTLPGDIDIANTNDCFTFLMDRDHDGDSTENDAGGFRRREVGGVGRLEMWTGDSTPDCAATSDNWVQVTDPDSMNITAFTVDDTPSFTEVIFDDGVTSISQKVRKLRLNIQAALVTDANVTREIEDVISVRNDVLL